MSTTEQNQLAVRPTASQQLASFIGMEPRAMLDTFKAQCFKGNAANISDAQLAAFVSIANEMKVNPLLPGMLYAYPANGGIVPMMGPDGVFKKLSENPQVEGWETVVYPEDVTLAPTHATAKIFRKGSDRPLTYTALLSEWKINANPNWNSRPRHMLSIRAIKQCARQIIHGIPFDEDERAAMEPINVTPEASSRPAPPKRAPKGAAAVRETVQEVEHVTPVEATNPDLEAQTVPPVAVTPVAPTPVPEPVAKPVESFAQAAEATAAPTVHTSMNANEKLTADVTVTELGVIKDAVMAGSKTDMAQATVTGEYNGNVFHPGGASGSPLAPNKPWAIGAKLRVSLVGFQAAKSVKAVVESVQEVEDFG